MLINRGYKFKILPTQEQKDFFLQSFGCARKIYNLYVNELYEQLEKSGYVNGTIKNVKLSNPSFYKKEYEYLKEIDSLALCNAQIDFKNAVKKFNSEYDKKSYTKRSKKREKTLGVKPTFKDLKGMPKYRSIKKNDFSYKTNNQSCNGKWNCITLQNSMLKIPKLKTLIKVKQHRPLPSDSIIKNCTISMDNKGVFYCSLCVEYEKDIVHKKVDMNKILGLDYSSHDFYVSSEGKTANYPHYYRKSEMRLKKLQKQLSKKVLRSNNWYKCKNKITTLQRHIANQRLDWLHKESRRLADNWDVIIVEDLDLRSMAQCLKLGKSTHDNGFGMFRIFLKYKLEEQGKQFIKIDKWYPSSKTCSCCGNIKKDLQLSDRTYICEECGLVIDRDYNASLNIKNFGTRSIAW